MHPFAGRNGSSKRNALLKQVAERDGWLCRMCKTTLYSGRIAGNSAVLDHIKPVRLRPDLSHDPSNLQLVCKRCHDSECKAIEARHPNDADKIARAKARPRRVGIDGWP